jgi:hypothetical protein
MKVIATKNIMDNLYITLKVLNNAIKYKLD